ncbi:MAG: helix-turn-helix domain-containing protein [Gemmatimonadaceae bacterium]|nr:helix-turn-helix domain-containing protein [Gloeobacterales cyanobacterium ES-bin-141]
MSAEYSPDLLVSLGGKLASERKERGLTLEDVADRTRIPMRYLQAIETGNSQQLPEPVYVRAFIRKYGDLVELDSQALVQQLQPVSSPVAAPRTTSPIERASASIAKPTPRPFHLWLLYGAVVLVAVGGLSYLQRSTGPQATLPKVATPQVKPQAPPAQTRVVSRPPAPAATPVPAAGTSPAPAPAGATPIQMQVALKERSWVRVTADGRTAFEGELPQGTRRDWQAKTQLSVRAGNAGGVVLTLNAQDLGQMGKSGQVVERVFRQNAQLSTPKPTLVPAPATAP